MNIQITDKPNILNLLLKKREFYSLLNFSVKYNPDADRHAFYLRVQKRVLKSNKTALNYLECHIALHPYLDKLTLDRGEEFLSACHITLIEKKDKHTNYTYHFYFNLNGKFVQCTRRISTENTIKGRERGGNRTRAQPLETLELSQHDLNNFHFFEKLKKDIEELVAKYKQYLENLNTQIHDEYETWCAHVGINETEINIRNAKEILARAYKIYCLSNHTILSPKHVIVRSIIIYLRSQKVLLKTIISHAHREFFGSHIALDLVYVERNDTFRAPGSGDVQVTVCESPTQPEGIPVAQERESGPTEEHENRVIPHIYTPEIVDSEIDEFIQLHTDISSKLDLLNNMNERIVHDPLDSAQLLLYIAKYNEVTDAIFLLYRYTTGDKKSSTIGINQRRKEKVEELFLRKETLLSIEMLVKHIIQAGQSTIFEEVFPFAVNNVNVTSVIIYVFQKATGQTLENGLDEYREKYSDGECFCRMFDTLNKQPQYKFFRKNVLDTFFYCTFKLPELSLTEEYRIMMSPLMTLVLMDAFSLFRYFLDNFRESASYGFVIYNNYYSIFAGFHLLAVTKFFGATTDTPDLNRYFLAILREKIPYEPLSIVDDARYVEFTNQEYATHLTEEFEKEGQGHQSQYTSPALPVKHCSIPQKYLLRYIVCLYSDLALYILGCKDLDVEYLLDRLCDEDTKVESLLTSMYALFIREPFPRLYFHSFQREIKSNEPFFIIDQPLQEDEVEQAVSDIENTFVNESVNDNSSQKLFYPKILVFISDQKYIIPLPFIFRRTMHFLLTKTDLHENILVLQQSLTSLAKDHLDLCPYRGNIYFEEKKKELLNLKLFCLNFVKLEEVEANLKNNLGADFEDFFNLFIDNPTLIEYFLQIKNRISKEYEHILHSLCPGMIRRVTALATIKSRQIGNRLASNQPTMLLSNPLDHQNNLTAVRTASDDNPTTSNLPTVQN